MKTYVVKISENAKRTILLALSSRKLELQAEINEVDACFNDIKDSEEQPSSSHPQRRTLLPHETAIPITKSK